MVLEESEGFPVFILHSVLMIPKVSIQPSLDEVQDILIRAGKTITGVAKGVGQWTAGRPQVSYVLVFSATPYNKNLKLFLANT